MLGLLGPTGCTDVEGPVPPDAVEVGMLEPTDGRLPEGLATSSAGNPFYRWTWYGNWCGPEWSGGQAGPIGIGEPVDALDSACRSHDLAWAAMDAFWVSRFAEASTAAEREKACRSWQLEYIDATRDLKATALRLSVELAAYVSGPDPWGYDPAVFGPPHPTRLIRTRYIAALLAGSNVDPVGRHLPPPFLPKQFFNRPPCADPEAEISPARVQLSVGDALQLSPAPVTITGVHVDWQPNTWYSSRPATVSVSRSGVVTPLRVGTATVLAAGGGWVARATINVVPREAVKPDTVGGTVSIPEFLTLASGVLYFTDGFTSLDRQVRAFSASEKWIQVGGVSGPLGYVDGLIVERDSVYWMGGGKIQASPRRAGSPATVRTLAAGLGTLPNRSECFASDGASLYFAAQTGPASFALRKVSLDGQSHTTLAILSGAPACSIYDGYIYYAERASGAVQAIPTTGGGSVLLAAGVAFNERASLRLTITTSLVILADGLTIRTVPRLGGNVVTRLTGLTGSPASAVVVGGTLYVDELEWGPYPNFVATGGCRRVSLGDWHSSMTYHIGCEAVDARYVYWLDRSSPDNSGNRGWSVLRAPK
jgi:hypothetical protein